MNPSHPDGALRILSPPYDRLSPVPPERRQRRALLARPGTALIWDLGGDPATAHRDTVLTRPGGCALILILPPAPRIKRNGRILALVEASRPSSILPHSETVGTHDQVAELQNLLRRPPADLPAEVTDYLAWRGIHVRQDTRRLIRRIVELSTELRSIAGLARSVYLSRRALGRRFEADGLPVPSHWLQFARLLRVAIQLQTTEDSVVSVGYRLGYPDGFSLSNQMSRLIGYRPTEVRRCLGWEWIMEAWLRKEADAGGLRPSFGKAGRKNSRVMTPAEIGRGSRVGAPASEVGKVAEASPNSQ